jgi:NADH-quinone oxidoreductase subunit N
MSEQLLQDLSHFLPEVVLTATILVAIVVDLIFKRTPAVVSTVVVAGLVLAGVLVLGQGQENISIFSNMLAVDAFAVYFKAVIILAALFVVIFSLGSGELNSHKRSVGEYYALLVSLTLGMTLMAGASSLLMMYLAIELSSLSSYILAGYTKEAPDSSEASLKYVIYGAVSSGLMLYGLSMIYGLTGTLDFYQINHVLPQVVAKGGATNLTLFFAGLLVVAGFGYKISAVPFHYWAPDVYEGAPITITALLAVASKAGGFALMIRFFKVVFIDTSITHLPEGAWAILSGFDWRQVVVILSVLTMTVGNFVAIWQNNMKRLLAYSSIAHAGYMLMGLVVLTNGGLTAILVYFVVYLFMNLGAFYTVMLIANKTGSEDIEDYKGLGARAPFMTVSLAIFLISLVGLPLTGGFIGKFYLFAALLDSGWYWLAVVGGMNSVVALYYYMKVLRNMFLQQSDSQAALLSFSNWEHLVVLLLLVPTLLFGVYFTPVVNLAQAAVRIYGTP